MSNSLRKQLATYQGRLAELGDELEAVGKLAEQENRDLSEDDQTRISEINDEHESVCSKIESTKKMIEIADKIASQRDSTAMMQINDSSSNSTIEALPARVKRIRSKVFDSTLECYQMGQWIAATHGHRPEAIQYCRDHGVGGYRNQMNEGTDTQGGYTVPDPLAATIIELVQRWGIFRQFARNVPMTSDTLRVPRLDGSLTVYFPGENTAITASELTFGQIAMTAQKPAQLSLWSTELNEDSVISMTDLLTRDIARNFAWTEDLSAFLGTGVAGTPTGAGPYTGISESLEAGAKVTAGANWAAVTLSDFEQMAGKLKEYPGLTPRWYISRYGYWNSMIPLLNALGGTNLTQVEQGGSLQFLGYPVTITQVLPNDTASTGDMIAVLGDLDLGTYLATRRQVSTRVLTERYAELDQLGIVSTMRNDINIHSVGTATEAGAIVGLYLGV